MSPPGHQPVLLGMLGAMVSCHALVSSKYYQESESSCVQISCTQQFCLNVWFRLSCSRLHFRNCFFLFLSTLKQCWEEEKNSISGTPFLTDHQQWEGGESPVNATRLPIWMPFFAYVQEIHMLTRGFQLPLKISFWFLGHKGCDSTKFNGLLVEIKIICCSICSRHP